MSEQEPNPALVAIAREEFHRVGLANSDELTYHMMARFAQMCVEESSTGYATWEALAERVRRRMEEYRLWASLDRILNERSRRQK